MFIETESVMPEEVSRTPEEPSNARIESAALPDPEEQRYVAQLQYMLLSSTSRHNTSESSTDTDPAGLLTD